MSSHKPAPQAPPQPTRGFFDPFNSSSTGHQHAENRLSGSTSWRKSRSHKLLHQYRDTTGGGGPEHISDLVGLGSTTFGKDGRKENSDWEVDAPGLRESGCQDIRGLISNSKKRSIDAVEKESTNKKRRVSLGPPSKVPSQLSPRLSHSEDAQTSVEASKHEKEKSRVPPQIFKGLVIFLNGSTAPLVSDHKLKRLFAQHGGISSIALGRRTVTHVILGEKCGGGLASGKIQKENATVRGKGIKYVTAQWVLDSIDKGIRQPESRYAAAEVKNKMGGSRQRSVAGLFHALAK
ncbi:hypothetical protein H2198_000274 [Neophaeococcomyces mojaviensis]|uniref:Uncharacterized protein n=1 Tax=Neophaeococcomyces mojaviensis TaxID=3383035 RepID=A0ACC3AKR6_9EURO|nr:hypothetical protein H2198_000274 [Knufia sp. JES_112]